MIGPESLRFISDYNRIQSEKQSPWQVAGGGNLIWRSSFKSVGIAKRPNGRQESNLEISNKRKLPTLPRLEGQRTEALQSPEARAACGSEDHRGYIATAKGTLEAERWGDSP